MRFNNSELLVLVNYKFNEVLKNVQNSFLFMLAIEPQTADNLHFQSSKIQNFTRFTLHCIVISFSINYLDKIRD